MTAPRPRVEPARAPASERVAYALGVWFGCGHVPHAPGTAGTLGALPLYLAIRPYGTSALALASIAVAGIGVWAGGVVARRLGKHDPAIVCIDEVAGVLVALAAAPPTWSGVLAAVIAFRVLDVIKPWPARAAERLPGGYGIVLDDMAAGAWAAAGLTAMRAAGWL